MQEVASIGSIMVISYRRNKQFSLVGSLLERLVWEKAESLLVGVGAFLCVFNKWSNVIWFGQDFDAEVKHNHRSRSYRLLRSEYGI
jgi:hypothetical protein